MSGNGRKVVIIGAGISGLSAAVYALKCGYDVEVLEMHEMAGGLATSWQRGPYTFEGCLHWLVGSKPGEDFHAHWKEICDIDRLSFVDPQEFVRIESWNGEAVSIYANADRLEKELMRHAPHDASAIHELARSVRSLSRMRMVDPSASFSENSSSLIRDIPLLHLLRKFSRISGAEYASRFSDPLIRSFFSNGDIGRLPAIAMVLTLGWMHAGNAGYCIGGSQALIRLIEEKIARLGGEVRFKAKVNRILVEKDRAVGVELASGEKIMADWVISSADGHSTTFDLLGGQYVDQTIRMRYETKEPFASFLQVSLGVARDLRSEPSMVTRLLSSPITVDPETNLDYLGFRFFHFDPTFAPVGKTAVTSILPTRNHEYWKNLRDSDMQRYRAEKDRIAATVIDVLDKRIPGVRSEIEVLDVSTPASVIRYTGNWKGSMEGWLIEPGAGFKPFPNKLPGLNRFLMVGQWVMPGGGLPCGPMTARPAVKAMCKEDRLPFNLHIEHEKPEPVGV